MASQYSLLRNYGEYVSPYNLDLISQSMGYMQQKVDTNREMLNQYADSLLNVDIMKPQDREYLQNKLQGLIQNVNNLYRGSNLASGGIAREIQSYIGQAMDSRVLNAVAGTREVRNLQKTIEDIKLNDPESYSPINEGMAYMPVTAWLEDGKVGSRLQPLHYTPYYDYSEEVDGMLKQAVELRKARKTVSFPSGQRDGDMVITTIDSYTPEEIIEDITPSLSQRAMAQINLEGQYMALTNPGLFNQASTEAFVKRYTDVYDDKEKALLGEIKNAAGNKNKLAALNAQLAALRSRRKAFSDEAYSFIGQSYDPARAGAFIVRNEFLNGVANRWSYDNSYSEMAVDDAYFKRRTADREDALLAIRRQELELRRQEAEGTSKTKDDNNDGVPDNAPGSIVTIPTNPEKEVGSVEDFYEGYATNEANKMSEYNKIWNSMSEEDRESVDIAIKNNWMHYLDCDTEADKLYKYFQNNGGASSSMIKDKDAYKRFVNYFNREVGYNHISDQADNAWNNFLNAPSQEDRRYTVFEKVLIDISLGRSGGNMFTNGRGLDVLTDNGAVNASDILKMDSVSIGGIEFTPLEAIKLSAMAAIIGEYSKNKYLDSMRTSLKPYMERKILKEMSSILGVELTDSQIASAKAFSRNPDYLTYPIAALVGVDNKVIDLGDKRKNIFYDIINYGVVKSDSAFGKEWGNYPIKQLFDSAYKEYENVFNKTKNQWGMRAYMLTEDLDKETYNHLLNIYSQNGGNKQGLVNLGATIDDQGQAWIIANYEKKNVMGVEYGGEQTRISVPYQDLIDNGIPVYRSGDLIRPEHYKTPSPVPVSFPDETNKDYQRFMFNNYPELPYATKKDAVNFALNSNMFGQFTKRNYSTVFYANGKDYVDTRNTIGTTDNGRSIETQAFYMAAMDNADKFRVDVDGTKGGGEFVEVSIYNKDDMSKPLMTYEEPNIAYVDRAAELVQVCPQAYYIMAINRIMASEMQNFSTPGGENLRTADMQAILSVPEVANDMNANINKYLKIREE